MSKTGVVKGEGIKAWISTLFGFTNGQTTVNPDATIEDIQASGIITEEELKELQESAKRVKIMEEKYKIEKFEVAQKAPTVKKSTISKNSNQKAKKSEEQEKEIIKDDESR